MVLQKLLQELSGSLGVTFINYKSVAGGDIGNSFLVECKNQRFFLKLYEGEKGIAMVLQEKKGLEAIASTQTIATPLVYSAGSFQGKGYILMEYVESKAPNLKDFSQLGQQLAMLHKNSTSQFGFQEDNFIGRLKQFNKWHHSWESFYWHQRILPQWSLAIEQHYLAAHSLPKAEKALSTIANIFPKTPPSLLHGDLWGGNYLISKNGTPYLIDPAVYYGNGAVDIGMSKLFGGFHPHFYEAYYRERGMKPNNKAQIDLAQLYFLLVHLNIFGAGYRSSVLGILNRYFG